MLTTICFNVDGYYIASVILFTAYMLVPLTWGRRASIGIFCQWYVNKCIRAAKLPKELGLTVNDHNIYTGVNVCHNAGQLVQQRVHMSASKLNNRNLHQHFYSERRGLVIGQKNAMPSRLFNGGHSHVPFRWTYYCCQCLISLI